jgi:predicted transcriptional regulator
MKTKRKKRPNNPIRSGKPLKPVTAPEPFNIDELLAFGVIANQDLTTFKRDKFIREGYLRNMNQREIAHLLGISQPAVSRRIKKIKEKILAETEWDVAEMLSLLNARTMQVYKDAYREFHLTHKWQFLQLALECLRECRETVSLAIPKRMEVSGPGGGPIDINDATGMSEDQVDHEIATIEAELVDHKRPPPAGLLEGEVVCPEEVPSGEPKPKPLTFKAVKEDSST